MKKKILLILLFAVMILIFVLSAQPATDSSRLSRGLTRKILEWFEFFRNFDEETKLKIISGLQFVVRKSAHFTVYGLLGCLAFLNSGCYEKLKKHKFRYALAFCLVYAITDEIHQKFVPGRSGELRDVLIDTFGSIFGVLVTIVISYLHRRVKKHKNSGNNGVKCHL